MLSMVNSNRSAASEQFPQLARAAAAMAHHAEQENYVEQKSIPVPVLVKHEEFASAEAYRHSESERANDDGSATRAPRGVLAVMLNASGNSALNASASSTTSNSSGAAINTGGTESDTSAKGRKEKRSTKSKCPPGLRSGKWTPEEEAFTNLIIHYFKRGLLHVEDGTSLRWYLAKRLNCEAMRVTKKLKGNSSIGKQIFRALEYTEENQQAIAHAAEELAVVESHFLESLASAANGGSATSVSSSGLIGTQQQSAAARVKRSSPHKSQTLLKPPHLETKKLVVAKAKADSEDAKLLLHFFVEAHDTVTESGSTSTPMEKKRLFSEVESSQSSGSSSSSDARANEDEDDPEGGAASSSPPSKRHSVKIENLM
ncbi:hypothetical protein Gpo141_00004031 [Globisporangium polare]